MYTRRRIVLALAAAVPLSTPTSAAAADVTLTANLPTGQPVGTQVEWTVSGTGIGSLDSRLSVRRAGLDSENAYPYGTVMYDYGARNVFDWTPLKEGSYTITAQVRDNGDGSITTVSEPFAIVPVPGATQAPVVSATRNPLVALYSAPACSPGLRMRVLFRGSYPGARQYRTDAKPCVAGQTMNFYIAGMRASTTHSMRHQLETAAGAVVRVGRVSTFATGAIDIAVPTPNILIPVGPDTSVDDPIVLSGPVAGEGFNPVAADLDGQLVWYYKPSQGGGSAFRYPTRWNDGGTVFAVGQSAPSDRFALREVDLAGNIVRETNSRRIGDMLREHGEQSIGFVHHEVRRLPSGHIALLGSVERLLEDVQGPGVVDVLGDMVIVLDENMQLAWSVNLFDILDVTRLATGRETCVDDSIDCPFLLLADTANDWTHTNSISYSPADGNLIVSLRHQDWVIKLDYRDGAGAGGLLWRLGKEGDFTPLGFPGDIDRWFTHQHDVNQVGTDRLIDYDNGNLDEACLADPPDCRSHGQAWTLDETAMTAMLATDADLGGYSSALGAAEALSNGNCSFNSGLLGGLSSPLSRLDEVRPDGTKVFSMEFNVDAYRGFRLRDLYTAPSYD
jgi:hypothetical protein